MDNLSDLDKENFPIKLLPIRVGAVGARGLARPAAPGPAACLPPRPTQWSRPRRTGTRTPCRARSRRHHLIRWRLPSAARTSPASGNRGRHSPAKTGGLGEAVRGSCHGQGLKLAVTDAVTGWWLAGGRGLE